MGQKGEQLLESFYHPHIAGLHEIQQYKDKLLLTCASVDAIFLMNQDCEIIWQWWAWQDGYCPKIDEIDTNNWQTWQITGQTYKFYENECHLNSGRIIENDIYISLLKKNLILKIPLFGDKSEVIQESLSGIHSPIRASDGKIVYGAENGLVIDENIVHSSQWVKRVYELTNGFAFTYDQGVKIINKDLEVVDEYILPRPFGVAFLENQEFS